MKYFQSLLITLIAGISAFCGSCSRSSEDVIEVDDADWQVSIYAVVDSAEIHRLFAGTPIVNDLTNLSGEFGYSDTRLISQRYAEYGQLFVDRGCAFRWMRVRPQPGGSSRQMYRPVVIRIPALISEKVNDLKVSHFVSTNCLNMEFKFSDKKLWETVTAENIDKPLAVGVNGKIFDTPKVLSAVNDGSCFVVTTYPQAELLLPGKDLSRFKPVLESVEARQQADSEAEEEPNDVFAPISEITVVDDSKGSEAAPAEIAVEEKRISEPTVPMATGQTKEVVVVEPKEDAGMDDVKKADNDEIFYTAEMMPSFPGGQAEMAKWLSSNIHYPETAAADGIQGRVTVQFVVKKDGSITDVKVVRGKDPALDKEAVRLIKSMPRWTPGTMNGEPVNVKTLLPINFKL